MRPYRTLLEQKIRERRMTLEEFCTYAENFAREHGEPGTLSLRHLQRLVAGKGPKGQPLGPIRPATARLLERIFEVGSNNLLSPPAQVFATRDDDAAELRERIQKARRIDEGILKGLRSQLDSIRRMDRQFGAIVTHNELLAKISHIRDFLTYSLTGNIRRELAILASEMHALAGWQSLDMGHCSTSWYHYEQAKSAALETENITYYAHATAEQAFTLIDLGEATTAVDLLDSTRQKVERSCPRLLRAWLAASHGETLAANSQHDEALDLFDESARLLPVEHAEPIGPYIVLDETHLARWRGHAASHSDHIGSISISKRALRRLDPTFARAETSLRVDLATAFAALDRSSESINQIRRARDIAQRIGSARQLKRITSIEAKARRS
ncbi:hypothetical protein [Saccharopolyspora sp. NPDC002578]